MLDGIPTRIFLVTLPAEEAYLYRMELLGTFLGAIAFGIAAILFLITVQVLLGKTCVYPTPMRRSLLGYVLVMFALALLACVQQITFVLRRASFQPDDSIPDQRPQLHQTWALPFAMWGADVFLIWRCTLLYRGVSKIWTMVLFFLVTAAGLSSLGSGILFFFNERFISSTLYNVPALITVASSGLVNIILRTLIVGRIVYHQQYVRKAMGMHHASVYTKIISMCVESCVMTSICGAVFLGLYFSGNRRKMLASVIPLILLPHTCIITPVFLVYRAAKGRNVTGLAVSEPITASTLTQSDRDAKMEFKSHHVNTQTDSMLYTFSGKRTSITRAAGILESNPGNRSLKSLDALAFVDPDHTHVEYQYGDQDTKNSSLVLPSQ